MELWVRSQEKESLLKIENISIDNENWVLGNLISDDNKCICDYWKLGHYETKERALEVLDEITSILKFKQSIALDNEVNIRETLEQNFTEEQIDYVSRQMHVYEMPKD